MPGTSIGIYAATHIPTYPLFEPALDGAYYLENSSPTDLPAGNSDRTVVGWLKVPQPTSTQVIFGYGSTMSSNHQAEIIYNDTFRQIELWLNSALAPTNVYGDSSYILSVGSWYFFAFTYQLGTATLYIGCNGTLQHQSFSVDTISTEYDLIRIGLGLHHFLSFDNLFVGNIEKVGIWNRCFTLSNVNDYFMAGRHLYADIPRAELEFLVPELSDAQSRSIVLDDLEVTGPVDFIGHWLLNDNDGSAADSSGNSYNGTVYGDLSYSTNVPYFGLNYSLIFDGSTNVYIDYASDFNDLPLSISVWINTTQTTGSVGIINRYTSESFNGYLIYLSDGVVFAWYFGGSEENSIFNGTGLSGGSVADGNWHHIVLTVTEDGGKLYVDGTLVDTLAWTGVPTNSSAVNVLLFGYYDTTFNGLMSDVRFYNDELSQDNVNELFEGNNPVDSLGLLGVSGGGFLETITGNVDYIYCSDSTPLVFKSFDVVGVGPLSFWNLSETSGTRYDSVGSNHLDEIAVIASFTYTSTVQTGFSTTFTDTSVLAVSWAWEFGDGGVSTDQSPSYTYVEPGEYTVTLTINGGGYSGWTVSHGITIESSIASFTDNSPQNLGTPITFTDTSEYPDGSWSWDFGDSIGTSTDQNPTYTYLTPGTFEVTLTIAGGASETSNSVTTNDITSYVWQILDVSSYFNDIGITEDGVPNNNEGSTYGLDEAGPGTGGNSFSGNAIQTYYPAPNVVDGVQFIIPTYGNNITNNVIFLTGQTINLTGAAFDFVYLFGFATNGSWSDLPFTINYSDASNDTVYLSMSDWFSGTSNDYDNEIIAVGSGGNIYRNGNDGNFSGGPVYIYRYTIAVDRTKNAISIVLPQSPIISTSGAQSGCLYIIGITEALTVSQMQLWVSADSISGLSNGSNLSSWDDLSGSGHNLTQSNGDIQPTYQTNIANGLPAIQFAASGLDGDRYTVGQYLTGSVVVPANYSVVSVFKQNSPTGKFEVAVSIGVASGYTFWQGFIADDSEIPGESGSLVCASDSHNDIYTTLIDDTNLHVSSGVFNGTYLSGWVDGNDGTGAGEGASGNHNASSGALSSGLVALGSYSDQTLYFNGYICEVLIFNKALSDSDRGVIQSYLEYKWGLEPQNEIQTITFSPTPNVGTYTLTFLDTEFEGLSYNITADTLQTLINNELGAGSVVITGSYD